MQVAMYVLGLRENPFGNPVVLGNRWKHLNFPDLSEVEWYGACQWLKWFEIMDPQTFYSQVDWEGRQALLNMSGKTGFPYPSSQSQITNL